MAVMRTEGQHRRWWTPTGEPCPRTERLDGTLEGSGDCVGCGFCLLLAGIVDRRGEVNHPSSGILSPPVRR